MPADTRFCHSALYMPPRACQGCLGVSWKGDATPLTFFLTDCLKTPYCHSPSCLSMTKNISNQILIVAGWSAMDLQWQFSKNYYPCSGSGISLKFITVNSLTYNLMSPETQLCHMKFDTHLRPGHHHPTAAFRITWWLLPAEIHLKHTGSNPVTGFSVPSCARHPIEHPNRPFPSCLADGTYHLLPQTSPDLNEPGSPHCRQSFSACP